MHKVEIAQDIIDRVLARRGRVHLFDSLDPEKTALVIVDMQNTFVEPGAPAEVPIARDVVPAINELATKLRKRGVTVIWVNHANNGRGHKTDWRGFFDHIVGDPKKIEKMIEYTKPGAHGTKLWRALDVKDDDLRVTKNRYSAFTTGASSLERLLRSLGIEALILAGTKTNVCVESTGRDAMALDYKVVLVSDCCAAATDKEHLATLETFIMQFGDVMTKDEVLEMVGRKVN
ncbi:MAG: cysteine hydrolase [Alphaproteobacteria bacterium]|nr:cysteine hydrolase [Alphaproteobacteria bacterium]